MNKKYKLFFTVIFKSLSPATLFSLHSRKVSSFCHVLRALTCLLSLALLMGRPRALTVSGSWDTASGEPKNSHSRHLLGQWEDTLEHTTLAFAECEIPEGFRRVFPNTFTCIFWHFCTCIFWHFYTCIFWHFHTCIFWHFHTCIFWHFHTCIFWHFHTCIFWHFHTCIQTCIYIYISIFICIQYVYLYLLLILSSVMVYK